MVKGAFGPGSVATEAFAEYFAAREIETVGCIGAGNVGTCTMAMMAKNIPKVKFTVCDDNPSVVCGCQSGPLPFYEPGLEELLASLRNKNLSFTSSLEDVVASSQVIFVCINTPLKSSGSGAGKAPDLSGWDNIARRIGKASKGDCKIIVECSTIPVATGETMRKVLHAIGDAAKYEVLCFPSFYRGGMALQDLGSTQKVLLGSLDTKTGIIASQTITKLLNPWISPDRIVQSNIWSAELSKLAQNAFIAQRISSVNAVSALCEKTGADLKEVMDTVGSDSRIGAGYLKSCAGMGGPTLLQNLKMLVYLCEHMQLAEVAEYWKEILKLNEFQSRRFCDNIVDTMVTVKNKKIAILGFAYKPDTSDTRESPAIPICNSLISEGCRVSICDPQVSMEAIFECLKNPSPMLVSKSANVMEALTGASAAVLVTDWDDFKHLDMSEVIRVMEKPSFLFDSRSAWDHVECAGLGFEFYAIGRSR
mmetsp:Transcript_18574/g.45638  ORF Transcript_18574/g.45638 Transcript_18574/m.45638 type:complete len:478 (-) Transcript_18574:281-1714(-)